MKLKTRQQLLNARLIESRRILKSELKEDFEKVSKYYLNILKKNYNIEINSGKDFEIFYDQDKNKISVVQEIEVEVTDTIEVTDEMRKIGIKGDNITTTYKNKDCYVVGAIRNCDQKTLDLFTFKELPKVKIEARKRREVA